jgi:hypothetical protein
MTLAYAAENGHLSILQYMLVNGGPLLNESIYSMTARESHLHIFEWARANGL